MAGESWDVSTKRVIVQDALAISCVKSRKEPRPPLPPLPTSMLLTRYQRAVIKAQITVYTKYLLLLD